MNIPPKKPGRSVGVRPGVELPSPDTKRWVVRRKADVVLAIRRGLITAEEACRRYNLSLDELERWQTAYRMYGIKGLRITRSRDKTP